MSVRFRTVCTTVQVLVFAFCVCMAAIAKAQSADVKIAVLQSRADQIDTHLSSTDGNVAALGNKIDGLKDEVAEMRGEEESQRWEQWLAAAAFSGGGVLFGVRRRKSQEEE